MKDGQNELKSKVFSRRSDRYEVENSRESTRLETL